MTENYTESLLSPQEELLRSADCILASPSELLQDYCTTILYRSRLYETETEYRLGTLTSR